MAVSPQEDGSGATRNSPSGPVMIKDQYLIEAGSPIPELDTPSAKAYAVKDRRNQETQLFALVCTPGLPARVNVIRSLRNAKIPGIMPMLEWDILFWPPLNQETMLLIYERPMGGRVIDAIKAGEFKVNEYEIQKTFIEPLYAGLKELSVKEVSHREVRPGNLYFMDEDRKEVVLGDCVTCPAGFDQPSVFEPIERGMASPAGRGTGLLSTDLYSLGVTLLVLMLGEKVIENVNETQLILSKIEKGTYASLTGRARIAVNLLEPLRGLLADEATDRWDLPEMEMWISGKRQTPMQRKPAKKADTSIKFMDVEYFNLRILAHIFTQNISEAAKLIRTEEFDAWVRRSQANLDLAESIAITAEATANQKGPRGSDEYFVARVCIMMDPAAPIRYKDIAFLPESYGQILAVDLLRKNSMQTAAEVITLGLVDFWINIKTTVTRDDSSMGMEAAFGSAKMFLSNGAPGYGIERCLYEMAPTLPCQSPIVAEEYAIRVQDLLPSLDSVADRLDKKTKPMDRHIAAFIAARFTENIEPHLKALAEPKDSSYLIGMLSLLAFMQWKLQTEPVFALSSWVGSLLGPAVKTYYSRSTRREIESKMPQIIRKGSLPALFDLIDNAERRREDNAGYAEGRVAFNTAEEEVLHIENGELSTPEAALELGQKFAAMTSVILSMIVVTVLFLVETL